jgi:phosphoribosylformylglycinamidine (FGAM) synthase-like enzyme
MGARPIASLNSLRFGNIKDKKNATPIKRRGKRNWSLWQLLWCTNRGGEFILKNVIIPTHW